MNKEFIKLLDKHTMEEDQKFKSIDKRLQLMQENHLTHIEKSVGDNARNVAVLVAEFKFVKWGFFTIIGALITGAITLIFK